MTEENKDQAVIEEETVEQPTEVEENVMSNETEKPDEEPSKETDESVSDEGELPVKEDDAGEPGSEIEQFKAQLVQSLELNDQLIAELEKKERELSVFKELKSSFETTMEAKNKELSQLKAELEEVKMSRFNEKKAEIFELWMTKFKLTPEQTESVQRMLAKFTSEAELEDLERMLSIKTGTPVKNPVALTQTSTFLDHAPASKEESKRYENLSKEQKLEYLWSQLPKTE